MNTKAGRAGLFAAMLAALAALAVCVISLAGTGRVSAADVKDVKEKVTAVCGTEKMTEGDNQMLRRLYGLEPAEYSGFSLFYPSDSMDAHELLIVKLKDVSQQQTVKDAMQARVAGRISVFEGYAPECVALLNGSVIRIAGNYAMLIVAEEPEPAARAFLEATGN